MGSHKILLYIAPFILVGSCCGLPQHAIDLAQDYFRYKNVKQICFLSCESQYFNKEFVRRVSAADGGGGGRSGGGARVAVRSLPQGPQFSLRFLRRALAQRLVPVGVMLDGDCAAAADVLLEGSRATLLDSAHFWLVVVSNTTDPSTIEDTFRSLNLSLNADVVLAEPREHKYELSDVFSFGRVQGGSLQRRALGCWSARVGMKILLQGFKYYHRWDFHNLTLRAITVVLGRKTAFEPSLLTDDRYTAGISAMTKVSAQILDVIKEKHNFRFNYTIADRWVGSPKPNSTLAVTNSMLWRQQDISVTCLRIFPTWLAWMDPFFPPTTFLETKFYYLIPESGVGEFENRFLSPLSWGVWASAAAAGAACGALLLLAARLERRDQPGFYAMFSVLAAACQQAYDDGVQLFDDTFSSQGRRLIILVLGLTSMLLYNYYTSSVVSWLLNAAAPTIDTMDGLIRSDFELTFEDIGYTRSWLDGPGFYYYSGFKSAKEDELRDKKVQGIKRTAPLLQAAEQGIAGIRSGKYAYHTEPYAARQVIGHTFNERELCSLGSLQMMSPAPVYVVGQRRSPYRQFFVWSLLRALERGHMSAARRRLSGRVPACPGRTPRALALGQAAPAFAVLAYAMLLAATILMLEILHFRYQSRLRPRWSS